MATTNLGRIGFVAKGNYAAGTYKYLDSVKYNGQMYICKVLTTVNDPSNATDWMLAAEKGADGAGGDVTLAGTQTLTNKTLEAVVLNNGYTEEVYTLTGTTPAISSVNGSVQTWTLTANSSPTDSLTTGQSVLLVITPSTYTITWPSVTWTKVGGSGTAPTLLAAGKTNVILWKIGSTLYGSHLGDA